jgi:hypothetical protein
MVTRVLLNDVLVTDHGDLGSAGAATLDESSKLEVQIDSPVELTAQTIDAMRNLASAISGGLKTLAVACWQARGNNRPKELDSIAADLNLICELLDHIGGLIDASYREVAAIQGIAGLLRRVLVQVGMARANSDWKGCAKLLLNRLEPLLQELSGEAEALQQRLFNETGNFANASGGEV